MDYGTRVAWMLEEDDETPLFLPDDRTLSQPAAPFSDARFSVSFLSTPQPATVQSSSSSPPLLSLSSTAASNVSSPSSSARSSNRSPRPSAGGPNAGGVLVSTGSMVSRYEKVMRASFRPPSDNRSPPKQQQQPQTTRAPAAHTAHPAVAPLAATISPSHKAAAVQPHHLSTPARQPSQHPFISTTVAQAPLHSHVHASLSRGAALSDSVADEEKQQVTFTSPGPVLDAKIPTSLASSQPQQQSVPTEKHEAPTAAAAAAPLHVSVSAGKSKQAVDKPKTRPPTPAASRWLQEQERKRQEQDEREAVWTERFIQEALARQRQRLTQTRLQQQQQQKQQPAAKRDAALSASTSAAIVPAHVQRGVPAESSASSSSAAERAAIAAPPIHAQSTEHQPVAQASSSSSSESGVILEQADERHTNIREQVTQWPVHRLSTNQPLTAILEPATAPHLQPETRISEAEAAQPYTAAPCLSIGAIAVVAACERDDDQPAVVTNAWQSDEAPHPATGPAHAPHVLTTPTSAQDEEQPLPTEAEAMVAVSSTSSSSSGSSTPVQLKSWSERE